MGSYSRLAKQPRLSSTSEEYQEQYSEVVKLIVGEEQKVFFAYYQALVDVSEFFRTALDGGWTESETRTVELPDKDPRTFAVFITWMMRGERLDKPFEGAEENAWIQDLVQLHILGNQIQAPRLEHYTICRLYEHIESIKQLPPLCVKEAFDNLPLGCGLQLLLADALRLWPLPLSDAHQIVDNAPYLAALLISRGTRSRRDKLPYVNSYLASE